MHQPGPAACTGDALRAGIGLRQPHYAEVIESTPPLGFVEVHSENFFADGGAAYIMTSLERARDLRQPIIAVLGVGVGNSRPST